MGALLKLILCFYVLNLCFGCVIAMFRFFIDVGKWHDKEKTVNITSSRKEAELNGRKYNDNRGNDGNDFDGGDGDGDNNNNSGDIEPLNL